MQTRILHPENYVMFRVEAEGVFFSCSAISETHARNKFRAAYPGVQILSVKRV